MTKVNLFLRTKNGVFKFVKNSPRPIIQEFKYYSKVRITAYRFLILLLNERSMSLLNHKPYRN